MEITTDFFLYDMKPVFLTIRFFQCIVLVCSNYFKCNHFLITLTLIELSISSANSSLHHKAT